MTIPTTIHFTIPEHPTDTQLRNIQIARDLHPGWNVVVWQDPVDRGSFKLAKYWDKANSGAQLADLIRLEVVFQQGGFYVDSDFVLLRSLDALRHYPFVVGTEDGELLTNAFFGAAPNSPVVADLIDELDRNEVDWKLPPDYTTGPRFFVRELLWRNDVTVLPRETIYPYLPGERPRPPRLWTYGTHLWVSSWKKRTGPPRPFRRVYRSVRYRMQKFGKWFVSSTRTSLITFRHRMRIHRPEPYTASGTICAQTVHGPKIYLLGEDVTITPHIALRGTYEFNEELFAKRVVRRGDWVIDVGANVGAFTLIFAQVVKRFGRVYSYEPNPLPASLLRRSLVMNWFHDRVEVRQKAAAAEPGMMQLRYNPGLLGGATLAAAENTGTFEHSAPLLGDEQKIDVEVSTLDADFPIDLPIRFLKIDAEGFDHHVLRGASRLLERTCVDILMLEVSQEIAGNAWDDYVAELKKVISYGYDPYILTPSAKLQSITFDDILHAERERTIILIAKHAKNTIRGLK